MSALRSWTLGAVALGLMLARCDFGIDTTGLAGDGASSEAAPPDDGGSDAAAEAAPIDDGATESAPPVDAAAETSADAATE